MQNNSLKDIRAPSQNRRIHFYTEQWTRAEAAQLTSHQGEGLCIPRWSHINMGVLKVELEEGKKQMHPQEPCQSLVQGHS